MYIIIKIIQLRGKAIYRLSKRAYKTYKESGYIVQLFS